MGKLYAVHDGHADIGKQKIEAAVGERVETGRAILREQAETGGNATHDGDAAAYGGLMLKRSVEDYKRMRGADEPVFFDRGIPELIGYFRLKGLPVPGLYAAGACASNIAQDSRGYASGTCIGEASFFGRRGGRHAAGT